MALTPGTRLGPYEILEPLGERSTGEVYRGRDSRLEREVAIVALAPWLSETPERFRRFARLALEVSAINHPNIAVTYDVRVEQNQSYVVMEHLTGETLRQRLARGRLAQDEAVRIAVQIAQALTALHRRGLVHRGLTPDAVFITEGGIVKITDFGSILEPESPEPDSAGLAGGFVGRGVLGYMAPEQFEGRPTGPAADVFSFGTILYEVLAGVGPFRAGTLMETVQNVSEGKLQPLGKLVPGLLPSLDRIVRTCLQKDPALRLTAESLARELNAIVWGGEVGVQHATATPAVAAALPMLDPVPVSLTWMPRFAIVMAVAVAVVSAVVLLSRPNLEVSYSPAHFEGEGTPILNVPSRPTIVPRSAPAGELDVTVVPIASCEPPCQVRFDARVSDAANRQLSYAWSGCASGTGTTATCEVQGSEIVEATVTVRDEATGVRMQSSASATSHVVSVFYATDRRPVLGASTISYSGSRNDDATDPLQYGIYNVSIPPRHHVGAVERPRRVWRFQAREDVNEHIVLIGGAERDTEAFFADLQERVKRSDQHDAFVFVHGFRVEFADAVRRTAQLAWDLGFGGAPILYSWPSGGDVADYGADYENARWTRPHFARFLTDVARRSGASTIYIIAHSMGAWATANALDHLASGGLDNAIPQFRELVLAAPDIDAGIFRQLASTMKRTAGRITLYAASDAALRESKRLRAGYPRAGEAGDTLVVIGDVDTLDASEVVNEDFDILDHSYFGDTVSVLNDISTLLRHGDPPRQRFGLISKQRAGLDYWAFAPLGSPARYFWVMVLVTIGLITILMVVLAVWLRLR
ncbi:MAG: alpha/beta hydrolase [Vicinamibacterales bacterium]